MGGGGTNQRAKSLSKPVNFHRVMSPRTLASFFVLLIQTYVQQYLRKNILIIYRHINTQNLHTHTHTFHTYIHTYLPPITYTHTYIHTYIHTYKSMQ